MKKIITGLAFGISIQFFIAGCNGNSDNTNVGTDTTSTSSMTDTSFGMDTSKMASEKMNNGGTTGTQNEFVSKAAMGGMMEVELGKIAQTNAASNDVKAFGKMMETDHSKANEELKSVAASRNISVPGSMGDMHSNHVKDLSAKTGKDFDKAYIDMMVEDHVNDIEEFKNASTSNADPEVKKFATKTLPTLQKHLEKAKSIKAKM